MRVDAAVQGFTHDEVSAWARRCEAVGFDGMWSIEMDHDPFFPLVIAAGATERIELGTGIALAFTRSPMHLAYTGWDLHTLSQGRFILGLGSQVRAHVTKRFSSEWSHPAPRMREVVLAIRAIWDAWETRTPLQFRGEFYKHVLMTPTFDPGPNPYGRPQIHVAGVGETMLEAVGEVADGVVGHPLQTELYVRETMLPALERGLARGGRSRADFQVGLSLFTVTSDEEAEEVRRRISFYASTPAYKVVLAAHGWEGVHEELHELSRTGGWAQMPKLVSDEMLETVAIVGSGPEDVADKLLARYAGLADRVNIHAAQVAEPEAWATAIERLKRA